MLAARLWGGHFFLGEAILKIAHFSDLHYSPDRLTESDRCFGFAVEHAIASGAAIAVISGDATDHRLDAHSPALHALAKRVHQLAAAMPVVMLQGTFSHEPPGTLSNFALMGSTHEVYIADRIRQVALCDGRFVTSVGSVFSDTELVDLLPDPPDAVFTCLPTINRGQLATNVGALAVATDLGDVLGRYLAASGAVNARLRSLGVPTVGMSHGTVNGCTTEHGVTMAGFDHEFSIGALFEASCDAFMLGHIHKTQQWTREGRTVAYPGSIGRFHYGETGDKGYLLWDIEPGRADASLVVTPSREMVSIEFDRPPDMERLAEVAARSADGFIRVRWQVDEEHRQLVDRDAIRALFGAAADLKLEPRIVPVVRSRAQGISLETTVQAKLHRWCELATVEAAPVLDRLQLLESADADAIAASVLAGIDGTAALEALADTPAYGACTVQTLLSDSVPCLDPVGAGASSTALSWLEDDLFAA